MPTFIGSRKHLVIGQFNEYLFFLCFSLVNQQTHRRHHSVSMKTCKENSYMYKRPVSKSWLVVKGRRIERTLRAPNAKSNLNRLWLNEVVLDQRRFLSARRRVPVERNSRHMWHEHINNIYLSNISLFFIGLFWFLLIFSSLRVKQYIAAYIRNPSRVLRRMRRPQPAKLSGLASDSVGRPHNVWTKKNALEDKVRAVENCVCNSAGPRYNDCCCVPILLTTSLRSSLIRVYTVCHFICFFYPLYCTENPDCPF